MLTEKKDKDPSPKTRPLPDSYTNDDAGRSFEKAGNARGLIQPVGPPPLIEHERIVPPASLSDVVRHFWWVRWTLERPMVQENLPHPAVHLVFQDGEARVLGVPKGRFTVNLDGEGWVFGVRFQPGGFSGFINRPVSSLTGRSVPARAVLGDSVIELNKAILAVDGVSANAAMERRIALLSDFLLRRIPEVSDDARLTSRLVLRLEEDQSLLRVEDLCASEGLSVRKVQRLFQKHVGVPPRWVISRYRLHETLARLEAEWQRTDTQGRKIQWASFALELGYYDQSHFIKDFLSVIGCSPEEYEKRRRSSQPPPNVSAPTRDGR